MHFQRGIRMLEVQSQKNNYRLETQRNEVQGIIGEVNAPIIRGALLVGWLVGLSAETSFRCLKRKTFFNQGETSWANTLSSWPSDFFYWVLSNSGRNSRDQESLALRPCLPLNRRLMIPGWLLAAPFFAKWEKNATFSGCHWDDGRRNRSRRLGKCHRQSGNHPAGIERNRSRREDDGIWDEKDRDENVSTQSSSQLQPNHSDKTKLIDGVQTSDQS